MNADLIQNVLIFKNNQTDDKLPKITKKQMPGKLPVKKWIPRCQKTKKI